MMHSTLKSRRVLITGGAGFVGSHLVRHLVREGAQVTVLERPGAGRSRIADTLADLSIEEVDVRTYGAVRHAMRRVQPEIVFHLAAAGVSDPFLSPSVALRVNVDGTLNVVRAAVEVGAQRIIHTGTSYEYGELAAERRLDPISPYAASKTAAWALCRMYYRTQGWPVVTLRLYQVYGPAQDSRLIPAAIQAALEGRDFPTTPGEQVRDWVYVEDVAEAYLCAATAEGIEGETIDIGTGVGHSVREVVERVFTYLDGDAKPLIGALAYRPGEVWSQVADPTHAARLLDWHARVPLEEGLHRTLTWYCQQAGHPAPSPRPATPRAWMPPRPDESARLEVLRQEILARVSEYHSLAHAGRAWDPGQSRVQYAGRVYDAHEMMNMTEAMLEFWLTAGRFAEEFERKMGAFLGVREVIPVNSGSSANLVAITALCSRQLRSRPLQPGDEVITPAVTFPTTLAPIVQNGLVPVLVDSQIGNYNIDVNQLEAALSDRTCAIFAAHTLGIPIEMDILMDFARQHDLYVIEDNCDALGSTYNGKMTGTFGHFGTSSFYPAHHITLGEGGAVYTNSRRLAKIARTVRDWGRDCWCGYRNPPDGVCGRRFERPVPGMEGLHYDHRYLFTEIGYNLKLTDPQAAVGVAQLDKLPGFIQARKRNFERLYAGLKDLEEFFILPTWSPKADPSWFAFPLTVRPDALFTRGLLQRYLEERLIETRLLFAGNILKQPGYRHIRHRVIGDLPVADQVMRGAFFVGVYPGLGPEQIDYIVGAFQDFVAEHTR
jgi:CDP-6-deoxy-D-xylo-4-hexulose-3-dehydrase